MRRLRGSKVSMIFQEPMSSLNPVYTVGKQIEEVLLLHNRISRRRGAGAGAGAAQGGADPRAARRGSSSIRTSSPAASGSG